FNLSEKFTGYELTSKIKALVPSAKVLLLLGTFDSVDDAAFEKCGASEKIVKPFDSNKFIALCKQLIDSFDEEETETPAAKELPSFTAEVSAEDQWQVSHSSEQKFQEIPEEKEEPVPQANALEKEVSDWGMSVPGIIGDDKADNSNLDLPPVIGEVK